MLLIMASRSKATQFQAQSYWAFYASKLLVGHNRHGFSTEATVISLVYSYQTRRFDLIFPVYVSCVGQGDSSPGSMTSVNDDAEQH